MRNKTLSKKRNLFNFFFSFNRLIREIVQNIVMTIDIRMQRATINALQKIAKTMLISNFENKLINIFDKKYLLIYYLMCNLTILHVKRVIIQQKIMIFIEIINRVDRKSSIFVFSMRLLIFENV